MIVSNMNNINNNILIICNDKILIVHVARVGLKLESELMGQLELSKASS